MGDTSSYWCTIRLRGNHRSRGARVSAPVIETLTSGAMIPSWYNSPLVASYRPCDRNTDYWTDDTLGDGPVVSVFITGSITLATRGLLLPEGIIGPVVNESITGSIALATGGLLV
jgi:hypothetical protein